MKADLPPQPSASGGFAGQGRRSLSCQGSRAFNRAGFPDYPRSGLREAGLPQPGTPDPRLAGRDDAVRVQRVLDRLVEPPLRVVVEAELVRREVHERQVGAVLAVAEPAGRRDHPPRVLVRGADLRLVLGVERDHVDERGGPRVDREHPAEVVEARLGAHPREELLGGPRVLRGQRDHRREVDVAALVAARPAGHLVEVDARDADHHPLVRVGQRPPLVGAVLLPDDRDRRDRLEAPPELGEVVVDHRLVAVQREAHHPAPEPELLRDPVDDLLGHGARAVVPVRAGGEHGRHAERVRELRAHGDRAGEHELPQRIDHVGHARVVPQLQPQRHVDLGLRHQPVAHLRDDAEVRLHEQLGGRRAEAALVERPGRVAVHGAGPGAEQVAVGQDHLQAAVRRLVDAVGHVGEAVLERVRDDAAPADVDDRGDEVVAARLDGFVEVEPAHARLDDGVAELLVDLEDPVHVAEGQHHRAAHLRRGTAVPVVLPAADGPEGDAVLVRDPDDRLDLLHGRGLTTPQGTFRADPGNWNGSWKSARDSASVATLSSPIAAANAASARRVRPR